MESASVRDARPINPAPALCNAPGVHVGALETALQSLHAVLSVLNSRGWRKEGSKVVRRDSNRRGVIALSSEGARAMRNHFAAVDAAVGDGSAIPATLAALLASGEVHWLDGWRGGSVAVLTPRPPGRPAPSFRYIELFAGIGGFRVALDGLNGQCVFASEICPHARATYAANSDDGMEPSGDITALEANDIPEHDLLTAGFPCQPFSRAGAQRGLADPRGALFYEVVRVARAKRPAALLLENVPNLLRVGNGHAMHSIVGALRAIGYTARAHVLNARAFGVPQHRERLFIAAFRAPAAAQRFAWPAPRPPVTLRSAAVLEALSSSALAKYRLSAAQWDIVRASRGFAQWPRLTERGGVARTLRGSYRKSWSRLSEFVPVRSRGAPSHGAAADARAGDADPPRFYTERECARVQGFPDSFVFCGGKQYTQIGNAVCPPLVQAIAAAIIAALPDAPSPAAGGEAPPPLAACTRDGDNARCLTAAAVNLLRGVTPPLDAPPAGGASAAQCAASYGRYGDEAAELRRQRVAARPPGALFCMACVETYALGPVDASSAPRSAEELHVQV